MTRLLKHLCPIGVILLSGCGLVDEFVLKPTHEFRSTPGDFGYDYETIMLPAPDGKQVAIWRVRTTKTPRKGTIVIVPGNDANKGRYALGTPLFVDEGWDMILLDYQGYGDSTGDVTFDGLMKSTRVVFDFATSQDDVVVGMGVSLGAPVLARMAAEFDLRAVVFESTVSLWDVTSAFLGQIGLAWPLGAVGDLVAAFESSGDWNMLYWITQVKEPKLFMHSPDDHVGPLSAVMKIYDAAPQPKYLFLSSGEHAFEIFLDPSLYRSVVNGWLDGVLQTDPVLNGEFHNILAQELNAVLGPLGIVFSF